MKSTWGIPWGNYSLEGRKRKIEQLLVKGFEGVYSGGEIYDMLSRQTGLMTGDQLMRYGDLTGDVRAFSIGIKRRDMELEEENDACDHEEDNLIKENTEG